MLRHHRKLSAVSCQRCKLRRAGLPSCLYMSSFSSGFKGAREGVGWGGNGWGWGGEKHGQLD